MTVTPKCMSHITSSRAMLSLAMITTILITPGLTATLSLSSSSLEFGLNSFESYWSPFSEEHVYYKPYIRIMSGRDGKLISDEGPGLLDLSELKDVYLCVNGLVFLYFKVTKNHGEIYDAPVMQYASHYCGFYNGEPGPGAAKRTTTLHGIVLLGNPRDYRTVSLGMLTTPLHIPSSKSYVNSTSLVIINSDGECILQKGREQAMIRIKGTPPASIQSFKYADESEERHTTICRLDTKLITGEDPSKHPFDTQLASKEETLAALAFGQDNEVDFDFLGCWQYPLLDMRQASALLLRKEDYSVGYNQIDKTKSELNPGDGAGLQFWTKERLALYGSPLTPPKDHAALAGEVKSLNTTYHAELAKKEEAKFRATHEKLQFAILKLNLSPLLTQFQQFFDSSKKYGIEAKAGWDSIFELINENKLKQNMEACSQISTQISKLQEELRQKPYSGKLLDKIYEAEKKRKPTCHKLQGESYEIHQKIAKVEVASARALSYQEQAEKLMNETMDIIKAFEAQPKGTNSKVNEVALGENQFHDLMITIKNTKEGEGKGDSACFTFQRKHDQSKSIKPSRKRTCQVASNSMSGGNPATNSWRDEIFKLLQRIFVKTCPYFVKGFAKSINGIMKGYLAKEPEGTGLLPNEPIPGSPSINSTLPHFKASYKITKAEDLFPPLKAKDGAIWDKIGAALKACEKDVKPLVFKNGGAKPLKFTFNGKELPHHVEQAEKEFSFNWAIDTNFRIFGTVLGTCMGQLDKALGKQFYDEYHASFLDPIRQIWLSNRDNNIFKVILGRHYTTGKADLWTRLCMEASFVHSGKTDMRPIRNLFVNSYTEPNFFAEGPLKGTRSHYIAPIKAG